MGRKIPRQDLVLMGLLGRGVGNRPLPSLSGEEWGELCRRAVQRGVGHLLYERLRRGEGVPAAVLQELQGYYFTSAAENTIRVHQLGRVLALFREQDIAVIVLKGAYLAENVYGSIALRRMCDVDLLVREEDLARAKEVLLKDGFHQWVEAPLDTEVRHIHHLSPFVRDGGRPITIELHWRLMPPRVDHVESAGVWERARSARVADAEVLALCPEDLLLHVCIHACIQHRLDAGVTPLLDVDAILHAFAREIDWDSFVSRAVLWGGGDSAALMLTYAVDLFGARVPDGVLERLAPGGLSPEIVTLADRQIFGERMATTPVSITLTRLRHASGSGDFIAILGKRLFPSRAELLLRYRASSAAWLPLIYCVHPFRILGIHGRSAFRLLMGNREERAADEECQRGLVLEKLLTGRASRRAGKSFRASPLEPTRGRDGEVTGFPLLPP